MKMRRGILVFFIWLAMSWSSADAIILLRTGDPNANITAPPAGDIAGQGWDYEGVWGSFLGTPIAPNFFISAAHIGQAGIVFAYLGANYTITQGYYDPTGDFVIWRTHETFPSFAPLYARTDEAGQRIVAIGRGTQRGTPYSLDGTQLGWLWGGGGLMRWGDNLVASIYPNGATNDLLYATFDQAGLSDEFIFSSGDSGGAMFLDDGGVTKLAGINYAVDGPFSEVAQPDSTQTFLAALYDTRGLYAQDDTDAWMLIAGVNLVPAGSYDTRISTKLFWIANVIALPVSGHENNSGTITYTKLLTSPQLPYVVEQSDNLMSWTTATTTDEIVSTNGSTQVIKAKVDAGVATHLFLRLRTSNP
ncbi:MAG: hypothetical protein M3R59_08905 [Verrucomicrobiota bacterium]|nr:hypothetical protein [Verrucomicrobiota bacterium]